jgi:signal transduction histidine kinase/ligand-binding sensor domain-containing protein
VPTQESQYRCPRQRLFLTILMLACIQAAALSGAEPAWAGQYTLREWHAQDGLPSEDVTRVHQDRSGYLWLATSRGLARFDGSYFESLENDFKALTVPPYIHSTAETAELGVVFSTSTGGLVTYRDGRFRWLEVLRDKIVNSLHAEADGSLWGSCDDNTLFRLQAGKLDIHAPEVRGPHRLVGRFATDGQGRLWIAGGSFIGRYEHGQITVLNDEFGGGIDFRVAASPRGGLWIMTAEGLSKLDENGLRKVLGDLPPLVGVHFVNVMLEDRLGTLWLGTRSQGLHAVTAGRLRQVPTSGETITGITEDAEGALWVSTNGGGLNRLRRRDFKVYDRAAGLGDNYSFTVSEDAEGAVWFGNRDGGVARLREGKIDTFTSGPGQLQGSVTSVLPDGQGRLWVTTGLGVFRLNPAGGGHLARVAEIPMKPSIGVAFVARNGDYWVGLNPDRVGRYRDGRLETFGPAEGFVGRQTRAFTEDESGGILIGTSDGKLIRFDGRQFNPIPLAVQGDADTPIQDIFCEPGTGLTWIATAGNGVYVLGGGRVLQVRSRDGLIDANITTILPDDQGYLWFGSPVGIFSLRRQELADLLAGRVSRVHPVIVGRDDGMHGLTCLGLYKPAAWKGRDGHLWFATRKGVVNFDPARAITDTASPPAVVAAVRCDDEARPLAAGELSISASVRKLAVRLSVLCLSTPDRVQIKYRLDGFDSQWITAGSDRTVVYPRLPPGQYRLRTMASLGNGVWNENNAALQLTVVPLWWQTLWFRLLVAFALVALVILVVRTVSHRRLRSRLERLEQESAIERERTRIARNIHDDLGASLTRISLLTQMVRRDAAAPEHSQLSQIYETVRQITRSMDEIVWAVNPKNDHLDALATYLVSYAQGFLAVAGIRCRLDLPDHLPAAALTSQTRHNLYLCLKEALNNVVKHSGADEVTIAMRTAGDKFTMLITDNGRQPARAGVNGANGHNLPREPRVSSGHGLGNIAQRVTEMGGTHVFIPAHDGRGTRLEIVIALGATSAEKSPAPGRLV